jgi:hypothetical protein
MVTLTQMFVDTDEYLKERGGGPLNPEEVVHVLNKVKDDVLEERPDSIKELWENIALCIAINVSKLRGYKVPNPIRWRGRTIISNLS